MIGARIRSLSSGFGLLPSNHGVMSGSNSVVGLERAVACVEI